MSALSIKWTREPGTNRPVGGFYDEHGNECVITTTRFGHNAIMLYTGGGPIVLTPEMCAELALVLAYVGMHEGKLPIPGDDE